MKIAIIGAGNLATHLGRALLENGHDILQVYSRTMQSALALAQQVGGTPINNIDYLTYQADVYIVSISDAALPELIPNICRGREEHVFLHTAGSIPMDVFKGITLHYGVLYPLQTFSKDREIDFREVPCFVEGNDASTLRVITSLAESVSKYVEPMNSEDRKYLHLSAVWACNFVNHCYDVASEVLEKRHIPFNVLLPLIDETAQKVHNLSPKQAQTGPAKRYDQNVIRAQAQLMKPDPLLKDLYERMSVSIHRRNESMSD